MECKIITKIEKLGYVVELGSRGTSIKDLRKSFATGEVYKHEIAYSTKENDMTFLESCYKDSLKVGVK